MDRFYASSSHYEIACDTRFRSIFAPVSLVYRLQEVRAFLTVGRRAHLNNAGNILDNAILPRLFFQMRCHNLIVRRLESWGQLILVDDGWKQREHQRFLLGEIKGIHEELAHETIPGASALVSN